MTTYGLTPTGFVPETLPIIRAAMNADIQGAFGTSIDLSDASLEGQIVGILAERLARLWELVEQVNAGQDPDAATGTSLDALAALTGTLRNPATSSTVVLTLTGTPATVVPVASVASVTSTQAPFATLTAVTLDAVGAWPADAPVDPGRRVTNAGRVYQSISVGLGITAVSGGPTTTEADITDGTVHWRYLGEGTASADVAAAAVATGPVVAVSGDLSTIDTPVGGWASVVNLSDATVGAAVESDADLRVRREAELAAAGATTVDAIRADLLEIPDVTSVTLFYNDTDDVDADGVPPHSVEALVQGGVDQAILDALFGSVAAGIGYNPTGAGVVSGTVVDSQGVSHTVRFTRPVEVPIYVDITVLTDAATYPADGDAQIKSAIAAYGAAQRCGKDAVASAISARAFDVDGVLDVTLIKIGVAPSPTVATTIVIALRELATYATANITVHTSAYT